MTDRFKRIMSCAVLLLGAMLLTLVGMRNPLEDCPISTYESPEYWQHRQHFVLADFPININHIYWEDCNSFIVMDYVVEKLDADGNYRTVYDSSQKIFPVVEELVVEKDKIYTIYHEVTLQPLVDIYGDGEYRVLQLTRNTANGEQRIIARRYYLLSGEYVAEKAVFAEVFPITREDLQNLEIVNGEANFALTEEEKEEFIDIILNMRFASVNKTYHNLLIMALAGDVNYGSNYRFRLNIPGKEECYIYSMTGKDLDGNAYQAVFVCGDTAICLDSEETILYKLDALKQKGALK